VTSWAKVRAEAGMTIRKPGAGEAFYNRKRHSGSRRNDASDATERWL
jgi:hypothetical protein